MKRGRMMEKRISGLLFLCTAVCVGVMMLAVPVRAETDNKKEDELTLHAISAVLLDGDSGRVLYGKDAETFRPMASTTKIMTCILALELGNPEDAVTASAYAAVQPQVHMGVRKGETYYLKDLLYALMLESYNDAAVMIAEHIGGSVEEFAAMMNQKARDLGCENTSFVTPNGLDAVTSEGGKQIYLHGTTARELALMMRYCLEASPKHEAFLEITRTQNHSFSDISGKRNVSCVNHNALLTMMEGALSGKTGFTGGAGYSYVGAVDSDGRRFVIALLGSGWPPNKTWKWEDARKLIAYGKEHYHYREVFQKQQFDKVPVENGIPEPGEDTALISLDMRMKPEEETLKLLLKEGEEVAVSTQIPAQLNAPVEQGMPVGSVVYRLDGEVVAEYPVYTVEAVGKIDFRWCVKQILDGFLLSGGAATKKFDKVPYYQVQ